VHQCTTKHFPAQHTRHCWILIQQTGAPFKLRTKTAAFKIKSATTIKQNSPLVITVTWALSRIHLFPASYKLLDTVTGWYRRKRPMHYGHFLLYYAASLTSNHSYFMKQRPLVVAETSNSEAIKPHYWPSSLTEGFTLIIVSLRE
jgi:hypothetical protein